jgi:hypothetical protein
MVPAAACRVESWPFSGRFRDVARRRDLPCRLAQPADPYFRYRALLAAAGRFQAWILPNSGKFGKLGDTARKTSLQPISATHPHLLNQSLIFLGAGNNVRQIN